MTVSVFIIPRSSRIFPFYNIIHSRLPEVQCTALSLEGGRFRGRKLNKRGSNWIFFPFFSRHKLVLTAGKRIKEFVYNYSSLMDSRVLERKQNFLLLK